MSEALPPDTISTSHLKRHVLLRYPGLQEWMTKYILCNTTYG